MNEVKRVAKVGNKIKVIRFSCQGWGKTEYEEGSIWIVSEVRIKPFGITFCEGANGFILNEDYVVLID